MSQFLGFDTSNYTTSVAIYDSVSGEIKQNKKLLPVKEGELGLRQSDAVFHHISRLPEVLDGLTSQFENLNLKAVSASKSPTETKGSYMPCFLVGSSSAAQLASTLKIPANFFSHQQGHVVAAVYGAMTSLGEDIINLDMLNRDFLAFHVSGGTTDALYVSPNENSVISCDLVSKSLDLKAGQLIDRVGKMIGLGFPAGATMEELILDSGIKINFENLPKSTIRNGNCCLSGVENQCKNMLKNGKSKEEVALFCVLSVLSTVDSMTSELLKKYNDIPIIYAGGVMSNSIIKEYLTKKYDGIFAPPEYSTDNAVGIAVLSSLKTNRNL